MQTNQISENEKEDSVLSEKENLHSRIIRDADKLDNFRVKEKEHFKNIFPSVYNAETLEYEEISDSVYEAIMRNQCVQSSDRRTQIDYWICFIGFIFDLNFDISLNETKEKMEKIRKVANDFLDEKGN